MSSKRKERPGASPSTADASSFVVDGEALAVVLVEALAAACVLPKNGGSGGVFASSIVDSMRAGIAAQLQSALSGSGGDLGAGVAPEALDRALAADVSRMDAQAASLGRQVKEAREKVSRSAKREA